MYVCAPFFSVLRISLYLALSFSCFTPLFFHYDYLVIDNSLYVSKKLAFIAVTVDVAVDVGFIGIFIVINFNTRAVH